MHFCIFIKCIILYKAPQLHPSEAVLTLYRAGAAPPALSSAFSKNAQTLMHRLTEPGSMLRDCPLVWSMQLSRIIMSQNNIGVAVCLRWAWHWCWKWEYLSATALGLLFCLVTHWDGNQRLGAGCCVLVAMRRSSELPGRRGEAVAHMGTCDDVLRVMDEENYLGCNASDRLRTEQGCICQGWRRRCCGSWETSLL